MSRVALVSGGTHGIGLATALEWTVEWYKTQAQGGDARALTLTQIERYMDLTAR